MYVQMNHHRAYHSDTHRAHSSGYVIRTWRLKHGVTQKELANMVCRVGKPYGIKISPLTISAYEHEKCQPKAERTWALCTVMGMNPDELNGYVNGGLPYKRV